MTNQRSLARRIAALEQTIRDRPVAGMVLVRYTGLSGLIRQAREEGRLDEHGRRTRPSAAPLDNPRPEKPGIDQMLWDALARRGEREAAQGHQDGEQHGHA